MATNKHAIIRYYALDRCFSNAERRYNINDLVDACNKALYKYTGTQEGVHRHQIYNDIVFMEEHWSIPLERHKDGRVVYFRYRDLSYSIQNALFREDEVDTVASALALLSSFEGLPNFEWVAEIDARFRSLFRLDENDGKGIVEFQNNPYLKGLNFFPCIFNAIFNKEALKIYYHSFKHEARSFVVHPYFLKQYSDRWYLISLNDEKKQITILALDRILNVEKTNIKYIENKDMDFKDYFYDSIGITVPPDEEVQTVKLRIKAKEMPYVNTKPLHGSQKVVESNGDFSIIELRVYITYELKSIILSFGRNAEVLQPQSLRNEIATIISDLNKMYTRPADDKEEE
jgi:predicted DNA-binding transcriptional regulator YafY